MRTLVVVGLAASPTSTGAIPASRHALASVAAASSWPVTATSVARPPSAVDVVRHVGRAADAMAFVIEHHDRDRRLGRDARDAAGDELVEHRVADDEHVGASEAGGDRPRALRRERRQHRPGEPPRTAA